MLRGPLAGGTRGPVCSYNPRWRALVPRFQKAHRCTAKSKRTGQCCKAPAVRGWKVCRFHGARGGAPKGKANAWKHGYYTEAAKAERLLVKLLLRTLQAF